jgi:AcrR family transcriptional regulator
MVVGGIIYQFTECTIIGYVTQAALARARRAESLAELRRREIVDAAFEVFSERGYHATAIADIARRLGMGHGTFYRYFRNKRDILDHVVDDVVARTLAALQAENAPEATATLDEYRAQVERIADALFALFNDDPRVLRLLLLHTGGVDAELERRLLEVLGAAGTITAGYLENGRSRGFLRPDLDAQATGEAVVGLILAGTLGALRSGSDRPAQERYKQAAIALMFDGIAPG